MLIHFTVTQIPQKMKMFGMIVKMKNFFLSETYIEDYYQNKFVKYCFVKFKVKTVKFLK